MQKKILFFMCLVCILVLAGLIWRTKVFRSSFDQLKNTQSNDTLIKIGAILPLTGNSGFLGEAELKGFQLAIQEFNSRSPEPKVEIWAEDSKGEPAEALSAVNRLLTSHQTSFIFSSLSPVAQAIIPVTTSQNIFTMLVSVLSPALAQQNDLVFKFYPDITQVASTLVEYLTRNNWRRAGLLIYQTEPGELFIQNFSRLYTGQIVALERFGREDTDFKTQLAKIKESRPDIVLVIGYPMNYPHILNQMLAMNFKVPLVLNLADYPVVNTQSAEALKILQPVSTWYSFLPESSPTFVDNYQQAFGVKPDAEAAYSYDAMRIFLAVMEICHSDIKCIQNELKTHPWRGVVSPSITFDADGNAILPISLIQYDKNKLQWASLSAN